jgi:hypothetical protein
MTDIFNSDEYSGSKFLQHPNNFLNFQNNAYNMEICARYFDILLP